MAIGARLPVCTPELPNHGAFAAQVVAGPRGGWVAVLDLGAGMTLSKWFPDEQDARRYPDELAEWLNQRCSAP